MSSAGELFDRVFPETPEPVNERHWLVETPGGAKEIIALHSPNYRDLAVVADGVIVNRRVADFDIEQRIEVSLRLGGRDLVVTFEKVAKEAGAPEPPPPSLYVYDLFVDGRSVTNSRTLQSDRERSGVPLSPGGRNLLLVLRMIPSAAVPGLIVGLTRGAGSQSFWILLGAVGVVAAVAGASYAIANRILRLPRWSDKKRLVVALMSSLACWVVGLPVGLIIALAARH